MSIKYNSTFAGEAEPCEISHLFYLSIWPVLYTFIRFYQYYIASHL